MVPRSAEPPDWREGVVFGPFVSFPEDQCSALYEDYCRRAFGAANAMRRCGGGSTVRAIWARGAGAQDGGSPE